MKTELYMVTGRTGRLPGTFAVTFAPFAMAFPLSTFESRLFVAQRFDRADRRSLSRGQ